MYTCPDVLVGVWYCIHERCRKESHEGSQTGFGQKDNWSIRTIGPNARVLPPMIHRFRSKAAASLIKQDEVDGPPWTILIHLGTAGDLTPQRWGSSSQSRTPLDLLQFIPDPKIQSNGAWRSSIPARAVVARAPAQESVSEACLVGFRATKIPRKASPNSRKIWNIWRQPSGALNNNSPRRRALKLVPPQAPNSAVR